MEQTNKQTNEPDRWKRPWIKIIRGDDGVSDYKTKPMFLRPLLSIGLVCLFVCLFYLRPLGV
jgi:hypothetical protein